MSEREENIAKIREACVAANSGISECQRCEKTPPIQSDFCGDGLAHVILNRPIRLADVLLAIINATNPIDGRRGDAILDLVERYNFRKDDLTQQSDETLSFLADLLPVTETTQ